MSTKIPKSISREEKYLDKMGGNDKVVVPKPISREEKYMYRAAGYDDQPIPDYPIGRNEKYWAKIIENGGGGGELITKTIIENGQYNAADDDADGYSSVIVNVPSGPAPSPTVKSGVVFRDYDGTIVYSYTKEHAAELDNLPAGPTRDGLLFQKWNWDLLNIKSYVAKYGYVEVGATYITDDEKTRYYIFIESDDTQVSISLGLNGTVVVDWGDGSEFDTITGSDVEFSIYSTHTYTARGKYTITIDITDGNASLTDISEDIVLSKAEIGSKIISIRGSVFSSCSALTSITIPEGVTEIGDGAFNSCTALTSITIPEGVTSIGESAFSDCTALTSITIPEGVTEIGVHVFSGCTALTSIIIPEGVTSISDYTFSGCHGLTSITIPEGVTKIGGYVFSDCTALTSITIPEGVIEIGNNVFSYCNALTSVIIPEGVTSISSSTFSDCNALTSIIIPEGVTEIGNYAFSRCSALTSITFESTTPPIISSDSFEYINLFCTIYVPTGTLEAYTTAENYPDPTLYTYVEY